MLGRQVRVAKHHLERLPTAQLHEFLQTRAAHDLDAWAHGYNHERTHQGKVCCGPTPMATFDDGKRICREDDLVTSSDSQSPGEPGDLYC